MAGARTSLVLLIPLGTWITPSARASDPAEFDFFEKRIRPVLAEHCYDCHSAESGKSKGGLLLDTRLRIREGGDSGPAVVPGDRNASLLLAAINHDDPDLEMPPKKPQLSAAARRDFADWIQRGAPDPREESDATRKDNAKPPTDLASGRKFWAFKRPQPHPAPATADASWAKRDLDHFILAKLEAAKLAPSPDTTPVTLLRRLHFDLTGLPPSPAARRAFLKHVDEDGLDIALEAEVDRLLASPRFGERWGRHWLDVARFGESSGKETNVSFPHAWRYRDYVIDAFNADLPYDRFIMEQVAGDLLPAETDRERARLMIATGFLAVGPKGLNEMNRDQHRADLADEQIDSLTRAVMASTVACARCHDHKFDPFAMEDYYALAGIFKSTETFFGTSIAPGNNIGGDLLTLPPIKGQVILNKSIHAEGVAKLHAQREALKTEQAELKASGKLTLQDALRIIWRNGSIDGKLETVDEKGIALPLAMGVTDGDEIADAALLERGEIAQPRDPVTRGFPRVIEMTDAPAAPPAVRSGRLELARWLTHPEHPLTARVFANRAWRHLFGDGLVRTVDNFGFNGERPSHPELLDHLALRFVNSGWSMKALVRELVLSRAYRQSSDFDAAKFRDDPENRLLWRMPKRRLEAEAIRDAMLAASGQLDTARPDGSLIANLGDRPISIISFAKNVPADLDGSRHRSVYLSVLRDKLPDVLELFDFAEPSLVTGDRETTNVPLQALYLMNSAFVQEQAAALAARVRAETEKRPQQIYRSFVLCFGRAPTPAERKLATEFFQTNPGAGEPVLAAYCQSLLAAAEFRNLD